MAGADAGGRLEQLVVDEVRAYVTSCNEYQRKIADLQENYGGVGLDRVKQPGPPPLYLKLYWELQRWPGTLLVAGGLLDQPDWTWQLIDLAGQAYGACVAEEED